jgi:uncharacterized membrane protein
MKARVLLAFTAAVAAAAALTSVQVPRASAATSGPAAQVERALGPATRAVSHRVAGPNISAVAAPSWQTNNTVWALAVAKGVV